MTARRFIASSQSEFGNGVAAASMTRAIGSGRFICSGLYFVEYEIPGKVTGIPPVAPTGAKIPVHPGAACSDLLQCLNYRQTCASSAPPDLGGYCEIFCFLGELFGKPNDLTAASGRLKHADLRLSGRRAATVQAAPDPPAA